MGKEEVIRSRFAKILFDEGHNQAWTMRDELSSSINVTHPTDSTMYIGRESLKSLGFNLDINTLTEFTPQLLSQYDLLIYTHNSTSEFEKTTGIGSQKLKESEIQAVKEYVHSGGSLLIMAEHETEKYSNSTKDLIKEFGLQLRNNTIIDPQKSYNNVASWILPEIINPNKGLLNNVNEFILYRAGTLNVSEGEDTKILARTSSTAEPANEAVLITKKYGSGKLVIITDSDIFGDDSILEKDNLTLFNNLVTWLTIKDRQNSTIINNLPDNWLRLKDNVNLFRTLQLPDGSVEKNNLVKAKELMEKILIDYKEISQIHLHDANYHENNIKDIQNWIDNDFTKPDFYDALQNFKPESMREDGLEHIVLALMYTQNGNSNKNLEAIWVRTVWPSWIADMERETYQNPAFIPIEFVDFTEGYNTHSAVLFPETLPVREVPKYKWGAIFCDREAARFIKNTTSASKLLNLDLPPEVEMLLSNRELAKEVYVLWDLVHDRTHSHGELPFDPFMIKQRIPYWMYTLEEMRCDLNTFVEMDNLKKSGIPHAELVKYAIILDRTLRFPISGPRVKNYDGLVGQIFFGKLHKSGALKWVDNKLSIDWILSGELLRELATEVNNLYSESIDRSRLLFWIEGYKLVTKYVSPHPSSNWAKERDFAASNKELTDKVLPDEFPLNVFYEALAKKLEVSIKECEGITLLNL